MDVMTPAQRRRAMQANRGRTKPERRFAAAIWRTGLRFLTADGYRKRFGRKLLGSPDLIFTRRRVAVFVDGCFWHGCSKCHEFANSLNVKWQAKIAGNADRDRRVTRELQDDGWTVIRVWEHELQGGVAFVNAVERIAALIQMH